jgi:hypothetical protein
LSPPRMIRYRPFSPKKLRKYHESEDTHRTSISGVSIPRCSIDLKPSVSGNGSLTDMLELVRALIKIECSNATENETLKEKVDPAHDDHLRYHHHHLCLHPRHHTVHLTRVAEWIRWCLWATRIVWLGRPVFEVGSVGEGLCEVLGDGAVLCEGKWGEGRSCAEDI